MGILKFLGISTKHAGQHAAGKHAAGKHAPGKQKPPRLPKGKAS